MHEHKYSLKTKASLKFSSADVSCVRALNVFFYDLCVLHFIFQYDEPKYLNHWKKFQEQHKVKHSKKEVLRHLSMPFFECAYVFFLVLLQFYGAGDCCEKQSICRTQKIKYTNAQDYLIYKNRF